MKKLELVSCKSIPETWTLGKLSVSPYDLDIGKHPTPLPPKEKKTVKYSYFILKNHVAHPKT